MKTIEKVGDAYLSICASVVTCKNNTDVANSKQRNKANCQRQSHFVDRSLFLVCVDVNTTSDMS